MTHQDTSTLFSPLELDGLTLKNRFVMAPMTRNRSGPSAVPTAINALYYAQRAEAGLIITEGTPPDAMGQGYLRVPGLYTSEQVQGWKGVTEAVHAANSKIFVQLMYIGRVSHPSFLGGVTPVGPSAIRAEGQVYTEEGPTDFVTPRELGTEEIPGVIDTYRRAAELAVEAGFDGVELHATSGYLPMQFLLSSINQRTDQWGGSIENRARFLLDTFDAVAAVRGAGRVGVRIGPGFSFNDAHDDHPQETYTYLIDELNKREAAYLHVLDIKASDWDVLGWVRERFNGLVIANWGYDGDSAESDLNNNRADLISFGSSFLANPDLPTRIRLGQLLNTPDPDTFYTDGAVGYIDYPRHNESGSDESDLVDDITVKDALQVAAQVR